MARKEKEVKHDIEHVEEIRQEIEKNELLIVNRQNSPQAYVLNAIEEVDGKKQNKRIQVPANGEVKILEEEISAELLGAQKNRVVTILYVKGGKEYEF